MFKFDMHKISGFARNRLRLFITLAAGTVVFAGMIALLVFFMFVTGKDQVMVPDVTGKELIPALLELQRKELYPRIQLRTSDSAGSKGLILEQNPEAGTIVKAERRINLVVSEGAALDKIANYLGKNISTIRSELASLPLLSLKEPFMYQYSEEPAGTIIQQNPQPGTDLTGPAALELVVSRGKENALVTVPGLEGLSLQTALERLGQAGLVFSFELTAAEGKPETVAFQTPAAGTETGAGGTVTLTLYAPVPEEGETAGLFRYTLPVNPYPLPVTVYAQLPEGSRRLLASVQHPGGNFTLPYRLPSGSTIILSMLDYELTRRTVQNQE